MLDIVAHNSGANATDTTGVVEHWAAEGSEEIRVRAAAATVQMHGLAPVLMLQQTP
mgnify:CR=1 FL=1